MRAFLAGDEEGLSRHELLARYHWLCGRLADYQKEPVAAVEELRACLFHCRGRDESLAKQQEPDTHIRLDSCQHDPVISVQTCAAKLEALKVYSASAEGVEHLEARTLS